MAFQSRFTAGATFARPLTIQEFDFWIYLISTIEDPSEIDALDFKPDLPELQAAAMFRDNCEGGPLPRFEWPDENIGQCSKLVLADLEPDHDIRGHIFCLERFIQIQGIPFAIQPMTLYDHEGGVNGTYFVTPEASVLCEGWESAQTMAIDYLSAQANPTYAALLRAEKEIQLAKQALATPFNYSEEISL